MTMLRKPQKKLVRLITAFSDMYASACAAKLLLDGFSFIDGLDLVSVRFDDYGSRFKSR